MKRSIKKAFTLVEMLIVVVIIGILAAALIPKLTGAQERARDAKRKADMNQLTTALKSYFSEEGRFPGTGNVTTNISQVSGDLIPKFIKSLPEDSMKVRTIKLINGKTDENGVYAYAPISRNNTKYAGMVVGANTETEGNNSNWVVGAGGTDVPSGVLDTIKLATDGTISNLSDTDASQNTEAVELEKTLCKRGVKIDPGISKATLKDCTAKVNAEMVYISVE